MKSDLGNCYFCDSEVKKTELHPVGNGDKKLECRGCRKKKRKTKLIKREI